MRVVLQRVTQASVRVGGRVRGTIGRGFVVLVGFTATDGDTEMEWMADKIVGLRVFPDGEGRMNLDVREVAGSLLVVSQFTLYGDARRGRRPSFVEASPAATALAQYDRFVSLLSGRGVPVETGEFGAMMEVELVNDGPVTMVLER